MASPIIVSARWTSYRPFPDKAAAELHLGSRVADDRTVDRDPKRAHFRPNSRGLVRPYEQDLLVRRADRVRFEKDAPVFSYNRPVIDAAGQVSFAWSSLGRKMRPAPRPGTKRRRR